EATGGTITLIGRSAPGDRLRESLVELARLGGHATYQQVDVTDPTALARTLALIKKDSGPIHGVIHAAGIPGGRVLRENDFSSFSAVLAPKMQGAVALDQALREEKVDFFVLFSSLAAELGD